MHDALVPHLGAHLLLEALLHERLRRRHRGVTRVAIRHHLRLFESADCLLRRFLRRDHLRARPDHVRFVHRNLHRALRVHFLLPRRHVNQPRDFRRAHRAKRAAHPRLSLEPSLPIVDPALRLILLFQLNGSLQTFARERRPRLSDSRGDSGDESQRRDERFSNRPRRRRDGERE